MAGSNTIEFRLAVKKQADGTVVDSRMQFRTKNTIISVLGIELSTWSNWQDFETDVVEVTA